MQSDIVTQLCQRITALEVKVTIMMFANSTVVVAALTFLTNRLIKVVFKNGGDSNGQKDK